MKHVMSGIVCFLVGWALADILIMLIKAFI